MTHPSHDDRQSASKRGYGRRWQKYRRQFLCNNPLCVYCSKIGKVTQATVVDHIKPHRGDRKLFWDPDNHQALCESCHNAVKKAEEESGYLRGASADGIPLDVNHHWHKS